MNFIKKIITKFKNEEGQSIIEYSLISFLILGGGVIFLPSAIDEIVSAYHVYIGSFYYVLSIPIL
jgi:hypothetical protein